MTRKVADFSEKVLLKTKEFRGLYRTVGQARAIYRRPRFPTRR
jgi:hypothetical protein